MTQKEGKVFSEPQSVSEAQFLTKQPAWHTYEAHLRDIHPTSPQLPPGASGTAVVTSLDKASLTLQARLA